MTLMNRVEEAPLNEGKGYAEAFFLAKRRAKLERRSLYLMLASGIILEKRPNEGPWLRVSPNGETEASGVGRKRVRRKKSSKPAEEPEEGPNELIDEDLSD